MPLRRPAGLARADPLRGRSRDGRVPPGRRRDRVPRRARAVPRRARATTRCASSSAGGGEEAAAVHGGFVQMSGDHWSCCPTSPSSRSRSTSRGPRRPSARPRRALARDPERRRRARRARPGRDPAQGRGRPLSSLVLPPDSGGRADLTTLKADAPGRSWSPWPSRSVTADRAAGAGVRRRPRPVPWARRLGGRVRLRAAAPGERGTRRRSRPTAVDDMARLGVRTLYLQVANPDGALARPAHRRARGSGAARPARKAAGLQRRRLVPARAGRSRPRHARARHDRRVPQRTARFDTVALDLEYTQGVPDVALRNRTRIVELTRSARKLVGPDRAAGGDRLPRGADRGPQPDPVAGLPVPPAGEDGRRLDADGVLDVPLAAVPRSVPLHGGERRPAAQEPRRRPRLVHPIGGIADQTTPDDYLAFLRAVKAVGGVGWSVYDYNTTPSSAWAYLRSSGTTGDARQSNLTAE